RARDTSHPTKGPKTGPLGAARLHPPHDFLSPPRHPNAKEGVQGKRRVTAPGVAVIPVAYPADLFGEAACGCRDNRPGRREGQQLQHKSRAIDHLAPAAIIATPDHPATPEFESLRQ